MDDKDNKKFMNLSDEEDEIIAGSTVFALNDDAKSR